MVVVATSGDVFFYILEFRRCLFHDPILRYGVFADYGAFSMPRITWARVALGPA